MRSRESDTQLIHLQRGMVHHDKKLQNPPSLILGRPENTQCDPEKQQLKNCLLKTDFRNSDEWTANAASLLPVCRPERSRWRGGRYRVGDAGCCGRHHYAAICGTAPADGIDALVRHLREQLPLQWRDVYVATASHQANMVQFESGSFKYLCDLYAELEMLGEVPFDQTVDDRVVGVLGVSAPITERRDNRRQHGWIEDAFGFSRDKGHFMAHCIGGGLDVNVFSQERDLNRGWSEQGKLYRRMENYCYEHLGTFCFSRPVYADGTSVPRWLEFGLMREEGTLWVEVFDN